MGVTEVLDQRHTGTVEETSPVLEERRVGSFASAAEDQRLAFRQLAETHLDRYYRLATVILGDPAGARDAVHDAFVTAWSKWADLRDPGRFEAWFGRIVVNTCRNRLKRERRWMIRDIADVPGLRAADDVAPTDDRVMVLHAFEHLKPDDRIVLALRYYHDLKVDDIATAMGLRPRAAASRLHRALERLRRELDGHEPREVVR